VTAPTPIATVADLEARLGAPIGTGLAPDPDRDRAQAVLDDSIAAALLVLGADEWVGPVPPVLRAVVCSRALRAYSNPEGYRSETILGYSYSLAGEGDVTTGGFTASELDLLRRLVAPGGGVYSVHIGLE
jgi:hypothetical protein